jgi:hypothetical protein
VVRVASRADHAILWQAYPLGLTGAEREALPAHEPARHRAAPGSRTAAARPGVPLIGDGSGSRDPMR